MCGIAGFFSRSSTDVTPVNRMVRALKHRGPDEHRVLRVDDGVVLGNARLAIVGLSDGTQPVANEDQTVWITFNGEIYNYVELKKDLQDLGHRFTTHSDTEVIVHLYEEYGTACVCHLRGMFAFALWDSKARRLLLARDRVGKKPLYYSRRGDTLFFASELNALLVGMGRPEPDEAALYSYLALGYVPAPATAYRGVFALPPAHLLVSDATTESTPLRYWRLKTRRLSSPSFVADPVAVAAEVETAVRLRLRSDVPVGLLLSGGIDSTIVTALASQNSSSRLHSFSIGFDERGFSELALARQVAKRYNTEHHEMIVRPDANEIVDRILPSYGQPFGDSSAVPSHYVARLAARHVKVVLNGDGGDEAFGGYRRYVAARMAASMPRPVLAFIAGALALLQSPADRRSPYGFAKRFARGTTGGFVSQYRSWTGVFADASLRTLVAGDFARGGRPDIDSTILSWVRTDSDDAVGRMMNIDFEHLLPDDLLAKMDIASMASSVEARSPFLDHEVLEIAATLTADEKLGFVQTKKYLRTLFADLIPPDVRDAPKRGFELPAADWLRTGLRDLVGDYLESESSPLRKVLNLAEVRRLVDRHMSGAEEHASQLWVLLSLSAWYSRSNA